MHAFVYESTLKHNVKLRTLELALKNEFHMKYFQESST